VQKKAEQAKKAAGFMQKNKKWLFGGATGLGILIPIFMFFFWLMLFKNVHIKNLYVTYRWAQFNRGINKALREQLEAQKTDPAEKPSGNADTTVEPTDTPEDLSAKTNAQEAGPDKINPDDPAQVEAEGKKLTSIEQTIEGGSERALTEAGATREVKPADGEGGTPEEQAKSAREKAKANVEEDLAGKEDIGRNPPEGIKDGVEEAKKLEEAGKSAKEAAAQGAETVIEGSGKWKATIRDATGPFVAVTFFCIFRDIYVSAKEQVNKIVLGGAVGVAQELNKTADCQKLGKCDANQVGAVANRYDNGDESFTESCGYTRATQSSNPACKEIDPQYVVNGVADAIGGAGGTATKVFDTTLDNSAVNGACSVIMNSWVQAGAALLNLAAIIGSDGGWAAAGKAVGGGAAAAASTAGGKALIANAIMTYGGSLFKDLSPVQLGGITDIGNIVTASASCGAAAGCPQVSDKDLGKLDNDYRQERIAANSKKSILEKFFDTSSPDSVTSRVALNTPSTPKAAIGRMKNIFASIANPVRLNASIGNSTVAFTRNDSAYAASDVSVYGLKNKVRVPPNLLPGAPSRAEALSWAKGRDLSELSGKLDKKCKDDSFESSVTSNDQTCAWDAMDQDSRYYVTYRFYQRVAYNSARLHNNQSTVKGRVGGALGSEPTTSNAKKGIDTSDATKYPCPAGTARSTGEVRSYGGAFSHNVGLCNIGGGIQVNASAAQAFYNMRQAAAQDGITLTGGGYRSYQRQIQLREDHNCADLSLPSSACSPPTARPGESNHEEGIAVDFDHSHTGDAVFNWLVKNAAQYGIRNLKSEPWHWSVNGG